MCKAIVVMTMKINTFDVAVVAKAENETFNPGDFTSTHS